MKIKGKENKKIYTNCPNCGVIVVKTSTNCWNCLEVFNPPPNVGLSLPDVKPEPKCSHKMVYKLSEKDKCSVCGYYVLDNYLTKLKIEPKEG